MDKKALSRKLLTVAVLVTLVSGCVTAATHPPSLSNSVPPEPVEIADIGDVEEPAFETVEPFQIDAAYVWSNGSGGYIASFAITDQPHCFDIIPANEGIRADLVRFDDYPSVRREPPILNFRLTLDGMARIPASRASYQIWEGQDEVITSSSAWYMRDGRQVFLNCQHSKFDWRVYRVSAIAPLAHAPE